MSLVSNPNPPSPPPWKHQAKNIFMGCRKKSVIWNWLRLSNSSFIVESRLHPSNVYLFKVNNRNTRKRFEKCSKLTIKTPKQHQWCLSGVFGISFEHFHLFFQYFYCKLWIGKCLNMLDLQCCKCSKLIVKTSKPSHWMHALH